MSDGWIRRIFGGNKKVLTNLTQGRTHGRIGRQHQCVPSINPPFIQKVNFGLPSDKQQ